MPASKHPASSHGSIGKKRKLVQDVEDHNPWPLPFSTAINQGFSPPNAIARHATWPSQAPPTHNFGAHSASFSQPSPWEHLTNASWLSNNQQPPQYSVPSLTDGSTTAGTSPSSQHEAHVISELRSTTIGPFVPCIDWHSPPSNPHMGSYSVGQTMSQPGQYYPAGNHQAFLPQGSFTSSEAHHNLHEGHQQHLQYLPYHPMAPNSQLWQPFTQPMSVNQVSSISPAPLDCQVAVPCVDPSCIDGIPCTGPLLPPCDKEDCPDGIPCEVPHVVSTPESLEHICAGHAIDICCTDDCPPETRCVSPCYAQDCEVSSCNLDRAWPVAWDVNNPTSWSTQHATCVDPRHTFHNHDHLPMVENPFQSLHSNHNMECHSNPFAGAETKRDRSESASECNDTSSGTQSPHSPRPRSKHHPHKHGDSCSHKRIHGHKRVASETSSETEQLICQWIDYDGLGNSDADICGAQYLTSAELQAHLTVHINQLPRDAESGLFPCQWKDCTHHSGCNGFHTRPKLKRHSMTHTGATPFECDECGRMMRTKDALDKHKRTHSGVRPYVCEAPGCKSRFATTTELKTHTTVHSGRKPHKCPICDEPFADSSNLSKHKKIHQKPKFQCPDCGDKMKRWDQMRRHFISQRHALHLLNDKQAEKEYKHQMDVAFKMLTPEEREIPLEVTERNGRGRGRKVSLRSSSLSQHEVSEAELTAA